MRLVVFGADGGLGQELVAHALERGHTVCAFSRQPYRIPIVDDRLNLERGDVTDVGDVTAAIRGQDAVVFAVGTHQRGGEVCVYSDGMRAVLAAMHDVQVNRIVAVSAAGVGDPRSPAVPTFFGKVVIPALARAEYEDMQRMEAQLEDSDVVWTIVKPLWLRDRAPSKRVHVTTEPRVPRHWGIARADVADVMIDALERRRFLRNRIWLTRS